MTAHPTSFYSTRTIVSFVLVHVESDKSVLVGEIRFALYCLIGKGFVFFSLLSEQSFERNLRNVTIKLYYFRVTEYIKEKCFLKLLIDSRVIS